MKKCLFILTVLSTFQIHAQTISGRVINEYQVPLVGVDITNIRSDKHTHTNEHGAFVLQQVLLNDTLMLSHLGYKTSKIIVNDFQNALTIVLYGSSIDLDEVIISPEVSTLNLISDIDVKTNPVNSSQDILRKVPGLFIGQHAGGGKAEQIFLRGFDIDHGTDINIQVDGLPVNMVSHAHGQGYADLHFLIPETIDKINFEKGAYSEDKGNFATAGYVDFKTKDRLENSTIKSEMGQFNTYRLLGMFNMLQDTDQNAYVASEYIATDGPFESPQNFNRINLFGKYSKYLQNKDKINVLASYFTSKWDASGQIPQRAVDNGLISRFGAIDDTEGGSTSRSNLKVDYDKKIDSTSMIKSSLFVSTYDFELYSNFTFFLEDPINGDQIRQRESRNIYGLRSTFNKKFSSKKILGSWQAGISLRHDESTGNELSRTLNRSETLENISLGEVNESNLGLFLGTTFKWNNWSFNPSLRVDYFDFQYNDALQTTYDTQSENKLIVSPKFNMAYNLTKDFQMYLKMGKGFHSNDTRVVVAQQGQDILPASYGLDFGFFWKPISKVFLNMAYWNLYLEQEFVYVGDAGIVEPSGETFRNGVDLSFRYQPWKWLYWNLDATYTHARAIEETDGADYIPLAPDFTLSSGINITHPSGWYGGLNIRHIDDRPANEDNSIMANGYTVTDLNLGFNWKKISLGIQIQNLFDTAWNEAQFATESRLQGETDPIEEIHFTPGTPFFAKAIIQYQF